MTGNHSFIDRDVRSSTTSPRDEHLSGDHLTSAQSMPAHGARRTGGQRHERKAQLTSEWLHPASTAPTALRVRPRHGLQGLLAQRRAGTSLSRAPDGRTALPRPTNCSPDTAGRVTQRTWSRQHQLHRGGLPAAVGGSARPHPAGTWTQARPGRSRARGRLGLRTDLRRGRRNSLDKRSWRRTGDCPVSTLPAGVSPSLGGGAGAGQRICSDEPGRACPLGEGQGSPVGRLPKPIPDWMPDSPEQPSGGSAAYADATRCPEVPMFFARSLLRLPATVRQSGRPGHRESPMHARLPRPATRCARRRQTPADQGLQRGAGQPAADQPAADPDPANLCAWKGKPRWSKRCDLAQT